MKKFSLLIILVIFSISCSKNSDDNGENLPLKSQSFCDESNLDWLNEKIEERTPNLIDSYVLKGNYKGKGVFVFSNCCAVCYTFTSVYDCSGELLGYIGTSNINIPIENITQQEVIWPEEPPCFR